MNSPYGKRSNPCAWYVGSSNAYMHNSPFCSRQSVGFVDHKPYCAQHLKKAQERMKTNA